jgi:hypothetical protein
VFDLRVALQREAVVPAHAPLHGRASPAASATVRARSVLRPSFPSPFEAERRSVRSGLPLLRFCIPSTCASRAALSEAASRRTIPLRRSIRQRDAAGGRSPAPEIAFLRFFRLASTVRGARHVDPSRFTPARAGHAPRSLFRAAFRYLRSRALHDRAGPRHLRSGDVHGIWLTLRSVPCPRVPAFVTRPLRFWCRRVGLRRSSPLAVIDLVPHAADFYGCRSRERESENSFPASLASSAGLARQRASHEKRDRRRNDSTGFWVVYRGQAEPLRLGWLRHRRDEDRPILPWALLVFFQACRVLFHSTPRRSFIERVSLRGPQFAAALFPWAAIRSWVLRATIVQETCTRSIHAASRALRVLLEPGPARVSKFGGDIPAVAGPSAYWSDLRLVDPSDFKPSHRFVEDVLTFRTDFLSEVSHRPV